MRRYFESLRPADVSAIRSVPDGIFLVRVDRAQHRWHKQKPYYDLEVALGVGGQPARGFYLRLEEVRLLRARYC